MFYSYGSETEDLFHGINKRNNLGKYFGHCLFEFEVKWMKDKERTKNVEDVLWRRRKLGLYFSSSEVNRLKLWIASNS